MKWIEDKNTQQLQGLLATIDRSHKQHIHIRLFRWSVCERTNRKKVIFEICRCANALDFNVKHCSWWRCVPPTIIEFCCWWSTQIELILVIDEEFRLRSLKIVVEHEIDHCQMPQGAMAFRCKRIFVQPNFSYNDRI
jgi:hypothetical protein